MIKFGVIYIEGTKVVLGTNGFCNIRKERIHYGTSDNRLTTWGIRINKKAYKLSRIMAYLFIDDTIDIVEPKNKREKVVIFINNNPLDLRIDNILLVEQKDIINRRHTIEDDVYLIDLKGNIIDCGQKAELCRKYKINKGTMADVIKGINNYCSLTIGKDKVKCIVMSCKEYSKDKVKERLATKKTSRVFKKDDRFLQVDVNGDYNILTKKEARELLGDTGGLNMCLQGKRLTAGGYIWIPYTDYIKNNGLIEEKLNQVKSNMFYGSKIKLKKF